MDTLDGTYGTAADGSGTRSGAIEGRSIGASAGPPGPPEPATDPRRRREDEFSAACLSVASRRDLLLRARRLCRNQAAAEDLVQDTLARAWKAWDRFDATRDCAAWLSTIMVNCFISGYRSWRRFSRIREGRILDLLNAIGLGDVEVEQGDSVLGGRVQVGRFQILIRQLHKGQACESHPSATDRSSVSASIEGDDRDHFLDEVLAAMLALPLEFRVVVIRRYLSDESYAQVARSLGIPIGTVMSRLHRSNRILERELRRVAAREYGIGVRRATPANRGSRTADASKGNRGPGTR